MIPPRPAVTLLVTGGTISTTTDPGTGTSAPTLGGAALSTLLGEVAGEIEVIPIELAGEPSWALTPARMAEIARRARDAARDPLVSGVVITHGTTTLEYTAFLTDLFLDVDTPVVLTGAMRKADHGEPDGPRNVLDAVRVAAAEDARRRGALIVFAGRVIAAGRAWKARRLDLDAFVDLDGDLGRVVDGGVVWAPVGPLAHPRFGPFGGRIEPSVALVKAVPGMTGWPLGSLPSEMRGVVVEALPGVGGIPPGMTSAVVEAAQRVPVVIASRAPYGKLPEVPTGGTGEPLRHAKLLSAGLLTAEQAWLLLMACLGEAQTREAAEARFRHAVGAAGSAG